MVRAALGTEKGFAMSRFNALAFICLLAACKTGSKNESPIAPSRPQPAPASGTNVLTVPLPDSSSPMLLWVDTLVPADGRLLEPEQVATIALSCTAPAGYRYFIRNGWVVDGRPNPTPTGGFGSATGARCDFPINGWQYHPPADTLSIRALRLYVWVNKGSEDTTNFGLSRPADFTSDIELPTSWRPLARR
jgi:hypothetical protein